MKRFKLPLRTTIEHLSGVLSTINKYQNDTTLLSSPYISSKWIRNMDIFDTPSGKSTLPTNSSGVKKSSIHYRTCKERDMFFGSVIERMCVILPVEWELWIATSLYSHQRPPKPRVSNDIHLYLNIVSCINLGICCGTVDNYYYSNTSFGWFQPSETEKSKNCDANYW